MDRLLSRLVPRSAVVILFLLTVGAVLAFAAVSHLVTRYSENQKARGRRLYAAGMADLNAGKATAAIEELRAALICDRGNSQYQLSLGRALRDTGRFDEAESYLLSLWEKTPEDGTINLALARVAARRGSVDDSVRYYHNAIYGIWSSDPDASRRNARIELIEFLLQRNALVQARSELLALAAALPSDSALRLQAAELFVTDQDYDDALNEFDRVLRLDHENPQALAGAGAAAFKAGRYRTSVYYLQRALAANPQDAKLSEFKRSAELVLEVDPFSRHISDAERARRIAAAFTETGERLRVCAQQKGIDISQAKPAQANADSLPTAPSPSSSSSVLVTLQSRWLALKPELPRLRSSEESDLQDSFMDLVFDIEQQTTSACGEPQGVDEALLLLARNRDDADQ